MLTRRIAQKIAQGEWIFYKQQGWYKVKEVMPASFKLSPTDAAGHQSVISGTKLVNVILENPPKGFNGWIMKTDKEVFTCESIRKLLDTDMV